MNGVENRSWLDFRNFIDHGSNVIPRELVCGYGKVTDVRVKLFPGAIRNHEQQVNIRVIAHITPRCGTKQSNLQWFFIPPCNPLSQEPEESLHGLGSLNDKP